VTPQPGDPLPEWVPTDVRQSCEPGFALPKVKKRVPPGYPQAAQGAGVQGAIWVEGIVNTDGRIREARVARALDPLLRRTFGVNEEALETVKKWQFEPAKKDGIPIRVLVTIELTFRLDRRQ
jgi:protein TonB